MTTKQVEIKKLALYLARENKKSEPGISKVYWFPDDEEVRLVEVEDGIPRTVGTILEPFYFEASPADNIPAPSGIVLIRPDEFGNLELPEEWGGWDRAQELELEE